MTDTGVANYRNHYFCLVPKPKPKMAGTFTKPHFKERNLVTEAFENIFVDLSSISKQKTYSCQIFFLKKKVLIIN